MKILYVAKHGSGGNNDEDAISHALEVLGHEVLKVNEYGSERAATRRADFVLFHKWGDIPTLRKLKDPKVCWYFDLVDWPYDPVLQGRCVTRKQWMQVVLPLTNLMFCTDGDWVAKDIAGKLLWLPQGADERTIGRGSATTLEAIARGRDILFTGISRGGGRVRESFVEDLRVRYGERFRYISEGTYGRNLANVIAGCKVVVAPDSPVTDRYCSNRIWTSLGFGAFLLHPRCKSLEEAGLEHGKHLVYYADREDLFDLIDYYTSDSEEVVKEREECSQRGLEEVVAQHLYRHRVETLLETVKARLGL